MIVVVGASDQALWTAAGLASEGREVRLLRPTTTEQDVPWGLHATATPTRPWARNLPFAPTHGVWDRRGPRRRLRDRVVGRLKAQVWWAPADDLATARRQARSRVVDAGGDVLDDVIVEGLESEDGRVRAVLTEHGRERFERFYADISPPILARWLELPSPGDLDDAAQVSVSFDRATPWDLDVSEKLPFYRLTRPGLLPGERALGDLATAWCHVPRTTSDAELVAVVRSALEPHGRVGADAVLQRVAAAGGPFPRGLLTLADARGVEIVSHTAG